MRFEISKSLNGDKIIWIARDNTGVVRFRADSRQSLEAMIEEFKTPKVVAKPEVKITPINQKAVTSSTPRVLDSLIVQSETNPTGIKDDQSDSPDKPTDPKDNQSDTLGQPVGQPSQSEADSEAEPESDSPVQTDLSSNDKDDNKKKSFWDRLK
jgi:hypothetical protein